MFEEKLVVGRFLTMPLATVVTAIAGPEGTVVDQPPKVSSIEQSVSSGGLFSRTKTSGIVAGQNQKARRNFNFLTYIPGLVTQTPLAGVDVLTGPMSGCWIMVYTHEGVTKVGHVGTFLKPTDQKSIAAKAAWAAFTQQVPAPQLIAGFNPFTHWKERGFPLKVGDDGNGSVYALVTTDHRLYSIYLYRQGGNAAPNTYRIAGLQEIVSAPRSALMHIPD